jgi:hypothetical protein
MQSPQTPGAGITGTKHVTLGGDDSNVLPEDGTSLQRRLKRALQPDRRAAAAVSCGQISPLETQFPFTAEQREVAQ